MFKDKRDLSFVSLCDRWPWIAFLSPKRVGQPLGFQSLTFLTYRSLGLLSVFWSPTSFCLLEKWIELPNHCFHSEECHWEQSRNKDMPCGYFCVTPQRDSLQHAHCFVLVKWLFPLGRTRPRTPEGMDSVSPSLTQPWHRHTSLLN